MTWLVVWTGPAARDMRRLDRGVAQRVRDSVHPLATIEHGNVTRLRGWTQTWRLRAGDWRVVLTYDTQERTIHVLRVRHRREAYRG